MSMKNYDPKLWGPAEWKSLEIMARALPDEIDTDLEQHIKTYLHSKQYLLPCEVCQKHYQEYITNTKLWNLNFSKKIYVMKWINDLHNLKLSNKRSIQDVNNYYEALEKEYETTYKDLFKIFICIAILVFILKWLSNRQ